MTPVQQCQIVSITNEALKGYQQWVLINTGHYSGTKLLMPFLESPVQHGFDVVIKQ